VIDSAKEFQIAKANFIILGVLDHVVMPYKPCQLQQTAM